MPTLAEHMEALGRAQAAGDTEAAEYIRQRAAREITGAGSSLEKLGAGMQDVVTGTKQLFGQASRDDVREQARIADMATGGTLGGRVMRGLGTAGAVAPAMLIPGAQSVGGAALLGAGTGLLMPTEEENVAYGKVKNAAEAALTAGLMQKGFNVAAPIAGTVLKKAVDYGRRFSPGGRQTIAEQAFASAIPAADRPAAQQALAGAATARTPPTGSGAPVTSGVATRQPALLEAERQAREAGGELGRPIEDLYERAAQQRWGHLQQEVGGDVPALSQAAEDVYDTFMSSAQMQRPFDKGRVLGQEITAAINSTHNKAVKGELQRILDQYKAARSAGDIGSLHELRMTALDDALSRLYQTDKKAAGMLRNRIEGFKDTFDNEMNRALGGNKWSQFLGDYSQAATARGQAQQLARAASDVNQYGQPVYSPRGQAALGAVRREVAEQNLPYTMGPRGSATAQNVAPSNMVLARARQALESQRTPLWRDPLVAAGGLVDMMGGSGAGTGTGFALALARRGMISAGDRQAVDIAQRLIQLHVDPARAAQALANMNLPAQMKQSVMRQLAAQAAQSVPAAAGAAYATQQR